MEFERKQKRFGVESECSTFNIGHPKKASPVTTKNGWNGQEWNKYIYNDDIYVAARIEALLASKQHQTEAEKWNGQIWSKYM